MVIVASMLVAMLAASPAIFASSTVLGEPEEVADAELSGIVGMGPGHMTIDVDGSTLSFTFSDISGSAFEHASGIITPILVSGDNNTIQVDLDVTIYFIQVDGGTFDIDVSLDDVIWCHTLTLAP